MTDELQALLDRVTDDVLKKADTEKEQIILQAKEEAGEIIRNAKAQAAEIIENAGKEAGILTQKGEEALKQASRDVLRSLRSSLEKRVAKAAEDLMKTGMKGEKLGEIIVKLMDAFVKSNGADDNVEVLLSTEDFASLQASLKAALLENLKKDCRISPIPELSAGFKLVFKDSGVVYDFSDKSLAETISAFLGPKLAAVITE